MKSLYIRVTCRSGAIVNTELLVPEETTTRIHWTCTGLVWLIGMIGHKTTLSVALHAPRFTALCDWDDVKLVLVEEEGKMPYGGIYYRP